VVRKNKIIFALSLLITKNIFKMKKTDSTLIARLLKIYQEMKPKEYLKYSKLPNNHNRGVDEAQVKVLMESFSKYGTAGTKVIIIRTMVFGKVNEEYIADGQHSIIAASRLDLPLNILIVDLTEDTLMNVLRYVTSLNNTAKAWSNNNYIRTFYHIPEYQIFDKEIKAKGLTTTDLLYIFMGGASKEHEVKAFKSGDLKFFDVDDSYEMLDAVVLVKNDIPNKAPVRRSLYKVLRLSKDYRKMAKAILKASKYLTKANAKFSENETDFLAHLIDIYRAEFKIK
jgi:hypothetical protein